VERRAHPTEAMGRCTLVILWQIIVLALPKLSGTVGVPSPHGAAWIRPASHLVRHDGVEATPSEVVRIVAEDPGRAPTPLEEFAAAFKSIATCLMAIAVLGYLCMAAVWLVWRPLNTVFEACAYEQAAKQALLETVAERSDKPVRVADQELPGMAWKRFLANPLLSIDSSSLLSRLMQDLLQKPSFATQLQDLFECLAGEGSESITRENLENVCASISGTLFNLQLKDSISQVEHHRGCRCSVVAPMVKDCRWLFDIYDAIFTKDLPLDKRYFSEIISLVLVWTCALAMHRARHKRGKLDVHALTDVLSSKVAVDIKIDLKSLMSVEAHAEVEADVDVKKEMHTEDGDEI